MSEVIDNNKFTKWFNFFKSNRHKVFIVPDDVNTSFGHEIIRQVEDYLLCYYESVTVIERLSINEDEMDALYRLQRTFAPFTNVFFACSKGYDDDCYDNLIKDNNFLQNRFAFQVMLDVQKMSDIEHIKSINRLKCIIDWNSNYEWTSQDYLEFDNLELYTKYKIESLVEQQEIYIGETIYLYGLSKLTEEIIRQFGKDFHFIIADMNSSKVGIRHDGIEVVNAREALYYNRVKEKILVTVLDYKKVCQELVNAGYDFPYQVKPIRYKKDDLDLTEEVVFKEIERQLRLWKYAYEEIRSHYESEYLFINPHVSGDVYLSCLYLRDYIRVNNISDYVYVVSNKSAQKVAELFGITAIIWNKERLFDIVSWGRYRGFKETRIKKMHPAIGRQRGLWHFFMDIDYNTLMQKWIFNAPERITSYDIKQEDADYLFEKYKLKKGRTVLISPYSHSVAQMDLKMFNDMVDGLIDKGYSVCTNIVGEEKALPRTVGLCLSYINCVDFLNKAGCFIGARSGFCDVISTTTAKMVVLYRRDTFKHFSIKEMGLKTNNILELCIDQLHKDVIVDKALEAIRTD